MNYQKIFKEHSLKNLERFLYQVSLTLFLLLLLFIFSPSITLVSQEASLSVWLQFGDDTAILLSAFSEIPFSLHLSSLAESVVAITTAPSQHVLAQGDGGGPLVKAELLVSTCELVPTHIEMDEVKASGGAWRLAKGSGWIRVNLDTDIWPQESEDLDFEMTDASHTFTELDTNVYRNFEQEQATLKSTYYEDHASNDMIAWDDLERAVLTPNHKENAVDFPPDVETGEGENANRELVFVVGAVFSVLCLSSILFAIRFMPCVMRELGKKQSKSKEMRKQIEGETFTQEEENDDRKIRGRWNIVRRGDGSGAR